jgi:rhamnosyltransferase subunit B
MSLPIPTVPAASPRAASPSGGRKVVITTFGSFGDLHPYMAVGIGLKQRGHRVVMVTSEYFRSKIEGEGLELHVMPPEFPGEEEALELGRRVMDPRRGLEYLMKELMMPALRGQYAALEEAASDADLILSHSITYAAPLFAEKRGLRWLSGALQPMMLSSAFEPPVPPVNSWLAVLYRLGPGFSRFMVRKMQALYRPLVAPVEQLRTELGLPPGANPLFDGQFSPYGTLALFSRALGAPQPDWPARTVQTGFPFYDRRSAGEGMPEGLLRFLDSGAAPVVVTLGTSAVMVAGDFYAETLEALRRLGRRGVLLIGRQEWNRLPDPLPEGIAAFEYAPHSELMPRAAAIVHQGGVGTTGQALRAGRPQLVVGFGHDQVDNGTRVARTGAGRVLERRHYTAARAASELRRLLEEPSYAEAAVRAAETVRSERGVEAACNAVESVLADDFPTSRRPAMMPA